MHIDGISSNWKSHHRLLKMEGCWQWICIAKDFIWTTLKVIFSILSDSRYSNSYISAKYFPILTNVHQWKAYLFNFQMMYKSQFKKNWPLWLVLGSRVTYNNSMFIHPTFHHNIKYILCFFSCMQTSFEVTTYENWCNHSVTSLTEMLLKSTQAIALHSLWHLLDLL